MNNTNLVTLIDEINEHLYRLQVSTDHSSQRGLEAEICDTLEDSFLVRITSDNHDGLYPSAMLLKTLKKLTPEQVTLLNDHKARRNIWDAINECFDA